MRHICLRELLKKVVPGRWQGAPILENVCQQFGHNRLHLPEVSIEKLFPGFDETPVTISHLPRGSWSTPLTDQIVLAKLARLLQPKTILEVGSFRGYTTRLLAENTPPQTIIHALDIDPNHGEAYVNTPLASRITRLVGSLSEWPVETSERLKYDFIFLDADHKQEPVESDTTYLLLMLADRGLLLWHDYADWGWMSTWNRVPEVLHAHSKERLILSIPGTSLAIYRQGWTEQTVSHAVRSRTGTDADSHWTTDLIRAEA